METSEADTIEIEFFSCNMGFAVPTGEHARSLGYVLDEHGDLSLLKAEDDLFYLYVDRLKAKYNDAITLIQARDEEVDKMIEDGYTTFNPESLRLGVTHDLNRPYRFALGDIGNMALLSVYAPVVYEMITTFMLERYEEEYVEMINSGREAPRRNGNSTFEEYVRLCKEHVVPKYPLVT